MEFLLYLAMWTAPGIYMWWHVVEDRRRADLFDWLMLPICALAGPLAVIIFLIVG